MRNAAACDRSQSDRTDKRRSMTSDRSSLNKRSDRRSEVGGRRRFLNGPCFQRVRSGTTGREGMPRLITPRIPSLSRSGMRKVPLPKSWIRTLSNSTRNASARWLIAPRRLICGFGSSSDLYRSRSLAARPHSSHAILSVSSTRLKSVIATARQKSLFCPTRR